MTFWALGDKVRVPSMLSTEAHIVGLWRGVAWLAVVGPGSDGRTLEAPLSDCVLVERNPCNRETPKMGAPDPLLPRLIDVTIT